MLGLPGDNTPPSRFVRAVAWTQTARHLPDANEAVYETFRILDNFNLPQGPGAAEGVEGMEPEEGMRSSTIWTTAWNLTDLKLNYHTQHNRRVRSLGLTKIDFSDMGDQIVHITLDKTKEQNVEEILPEI
jgi:choloylglycine hydrolase